MKKTDVLLKEYVVGLNTECLKNLSVSLDQRMGSDLADALNTIANHQELDRWLSSSKSCEELYDMIDKVQEYVDRELNKRLPDLEVA
jgi:hypothetical protein